MTALTVAPNFSLTHIVGHPVALGDYRGSSVVLVFSGHDSTDQARQISRAIRSRHDSEGLPIISILDLSGVPKMMHGFAKGRIQGGYQEVVRDVTAMMQQHGKQVPADPSRAARLGWRGDRELRAQGCREASYRGRRRWRRQHSRLWQRAAGRRADPRAFRLTQTRIPQRNEREGRAQHRALGPPSR